MQVFISYGREDALGFAERLSEWLREQGYESWLDVEKGIPVGTPFDVRIEIGISGSDILLAVLSPWAVREEGFCRNEILFAQWMKKPIIPVRIADVIPPIQIISLNYLDARGDPDRIFEQLPAVIAQVAATGISPMRGLETAVRAKATGKEIAWHPLSLEHIAIPPGKPRWGGVQSGYVGILVLEGNLGLGS